jgi:hypothetical protein
VQLTVSATPEQSPVPVTVIDVGNPPCNTPPKIALVHTFATAKVVADPLPAFLAAKFAAEPDATAPATPDADAEFACVLRSMNFGNATADKIPKITMTITNSISVNPPCDAFIPFPMSNSSFFVSTLGLNFLLFF